MKKRILMSGPKVTGQEMKYIEKAIKTGWIVPLGENVNEFENSLSQYTGVKSAVALSSGTSAIHLGLKYLGVKPGNTVFCSDVTFAASCNPIVYEHASPVFIDSDRKSLNMSPMALKKAFEAAAKTNKLPKAVVIVDLYGLPADYDKLLPICEEYGVPVLEDAAEALGSTYNGKKCGSFGKIGALSFNGNKIITTSGGGMALCHNKEAADKIKFWATQSRDSAPHYQHSEIGYNYRLSNICAAVGRGQFEFIENFVQKRRWINSYYRNELKDCPIDFTPEIDGSLPNYWLTVILLKPEAKISCADVIEALSEENIESRPFWKPMHMQPVFKNCEFFTDDEDEPTGEAFFSNGLCLPSGAELSEEDLDTVVKVIKRQF